MKPVILIVMDGWGVNPDARGNAAMMADTPNLKRFAGRYPSTELGASGNAVGLPEGQMGNSEVGHLTLGAGRVIYQELTRINRAVEDRSFYDNPSLLDAFAAIKESAGAALHVMGLLSDGGVHSHIRHLYAIVRAAKKAGLRRVYVHAFLDGRDTPPESGKRYVEDLTRNLGEIGLGRVATVSGRYYAMDRDRRWDRVKRAYDAIVMGEGAVSNDPVEAVGEASKKGQTDEFVEPVVILDGGAPVATVEDNDGVIFFNFRADRARELTSAFIEDGFDGFERKKRPRVSVFLTMTEYDKLFRLPVVFLPQELKNILPGVLSKNRIQQFRVSETEKYAHVTFFFNGGVEAPFEGEERLLIPSVRDVPTYDMKPEMRAREIASAALERLNEDGYGFILINFPNGDMVGHSGVIPAAVKACEAVDRAVGMVVDTAVTRGWAAVITSDHGNVEQMIDPLTGGPHTAHSLNPVPFILADEKKRGITLKSNKGLCDVAPTILKIMGIEIPGEMTGQPLF